MVSHTQLQLKWTNMQLPVWTKVSDHFLLSASEMLSLIHRDVFANSKDTPLLDRVLPLQITLQLTAFCDAWNMVSHTQLQLKWTNMQLPVWTKFSDHFLLSASEMLSLIQPIDG